MWRVGLYARAYMMTRLRCWDVQGGHSDCGLDSSYLLVFLLLGILELFLHVPGFRVKPVTRAYE